MSLISAFDWSHAVAAALGWAVIRSLTWLFVALFRAPAEVLLTRYRIVKLLSRLSPRHPAFDASWHIEWSVKSKNFPSSNRDRVKVFKFLNYVGAELESETLDGKAIRYGFVGKLHGSILTGSWVDSRGSDFGYYGPFQIVMAATMHSAEGKWIGFAQDRTVKAGDLVWTKD